MVIRRFRWLRLDGQSGQSVNDEENEQWKILCRSGAVSIGVLSEEIGPFAEVDALVASWFLLLRTTSSSNSHFIQKSWIAYGFCLTKSTPFLMLPIKVSLAFLTKPSS